MPVPIWYIEFRQKHGRDPKPDELTLPQRRSLLNCARKNRVNGCYSATAVVDMLRLSGLAHPSELPPDEDGT